MANKNITPSTSTVLASLWFAEYLQDKLGDDNENAVRLAKAIGMERKAIYDYAYLKRSPKLEVVAKILAYYGETIAVIPITKEAYQYKGGRCSRCGRAFE